VGGKSHYEIKVFFSKRRSPQLFAPLQILMSTHLSCEMFPMPTVNTTGYLKSWDCFVQINGVYQIPTYKKAINIIMGHGWIFHTDNDEWTEEKKHQHGSGNLKDLKRFWNGLWSLVRCPSNSSGIIGENSELYRGKRRLQKVLNKRVTLIVASVNWRKTYFIEIFPSFLKFFLQLQILQII